MVAILMMLEKLSVLGLLRIRVFWNKNYDIIISVHDVTNKVLSRYSNYVVDDVQSLVSSISMREVIITSTL